MGIMGVFMYIAAPQIIGVMTPIEEIRTLGTDILRIEAFAEPMFAAAIVTYGIFVGGGQYVHSQPDEFRKYLGYKTNTGGFARPNNGITRRMAGYVYRTLLSRNDISFQIMARQMDL